MDNLIATLRQLAANHSDCPENTPEGRAAAILASQERDIEVLRKSNAKLRGQLSQTERERDRAKEELFAHVAMSASGGRRPDQLPDRDTVMVPVPLERLNALRTELAALSDRVAQLPQGGLK